ncbi:hypothetical protein L3Y34_012063 [Caenorhabditis briggsae]|uniref:Uncharacterized protein n=1 Tax=Caenorhabditis briggsae TaxID=6238 RepID=A0AAE8ZQG6_CAEBR|nr:hypothetical protein L3Y34_012063 [Caenorhabditis briggsae]
MEKIFGNKVIRTPKKTPPEPGSRDSFTDEPPKPVGPSFAHSLYERSLAADWVPTRQYAEESSQESFDSTLDYDPAEEWYIDSQEEPSDTDSSTCVSSSSSPDTSAVEELNSSADHEETEATTSEQTENQLLQ